MNALAWVLIRPGHVFLFGPRHGPFLLMTFLGLAFFAVVATAVVLVVWQLSKK